MNRGGKVKVVKSRVRTVLFENIGESAEPRTTFDDNGAILPFRIGRFEQVTGAIPLQRTAAGAKTDKAE